MDNPTVLFAAGALVGFLLGLATCAGVYGAIVFLSLKEDAP